MPSGTQCRGNGNKRHATVQEQRLDSEEVNTQRQERAAAVIKDLSEEIARMKAAEQRKHDAFTSLAHLLSTVKHVTEQIAEVRPPRILAVQSCSWCSVHVSECCCTARLRHRHEKTVTAGTLTLIPVQADPGQVTVQDIQAVVRDNALPEWVGQALTEAHSGDNDETAAPAAVAHAAADDGEVVTSRDRSFDHMHAPVATGDEERGQKEQAERTALPQRPGTPDASALRAQLTPRSAANAPSAIPSPAAAAATAAAAPPLADANAQSAHPSDSGADTSTRSQETWGSGAEVDDETKAVIVRAVQWHEGQRSGALQSAPALSAGALAHERRGHSGRAADCHYAVPGTHLPSRTCIIQPVTCCLRIFQWKCSRTVLCQR